jgi:hypothetical protein
MHNLIHQRCFNHALREAAACCPACGRCFCRECVTEHEERLTCAACLRKLVKPPLTQRTGFVAVVRALECLTGVFAAWAVFYLIGRVLVSMPDSFHEGTLWKSSLFGVQAEMSGRGEETSR